MHGFIVTIRSAVSGKALKGCTIGDLGPKTVANGADNGFLSLKDVVIPYDNMLDKLSQIDENGQFQSDIQNNKERLSVMLSAFSGPRIGVVVLPPIAMHLCL